MIIRKPRGSFTKSPRVDRYVEGLTWFGLNPIRWIGIQRPGSGGGGSAAQLVTRGSAGQRLGYAVWRLDGASGSGGWRCAPVASDLRWRVAGAHRNRCSGARFGPGERRGGRGSDGELDGWVGEALRWPEHGHRRRGAAPKLRRAIAVAGGREERGTGMATVLTSWRSSGGARTSRKGGDVVDRRRRWCSEHGGGAARARERGRGRGAGRGEHAGKACPL